MPQSIFNEDISYAVKILYIAGEEYRLAKLKKFISISNSIFNITLCSSCIFALMSSLRSYDY